jgi:hypothetical protein
MELKDGDCEAQFRTLSAEVELWLFVPPNIRPNCETISEMMCDIEQMNYEIDYLFKITVAFLIAIIPTFLVWIGAHRE